MKILNISFSKKGYEKFTSLTRTEQIKAVKKKNRLLTEKEIKNKLKEVPYGKRKTVHKRSEESKQPSKASNVGGGTGNTEERATTKKPKD